MISVDKQGYHAPCSQLRSARLVRVHTYAIACGVCEAVSIELIRRASLGSVNDGARLHFDKRLTHLYASTIALCGVTGLLYCAGAP